MSTRLFEAIKVARNITDEVIVSFSTGKDSVVVLDLCLQHFKKVHVFYMYYIPGLSFAEATLRWWENRMGSEILRIPHFELSTFLTYGVMRKEDYSSPEITPADVYNYVRMHFNCWWIAAGERINDSMWRRAMIKSTGGAVDKKRGRFYPIERYTNQDIFDYLRFRRLKYAPETSVLKHSWRGFNPEEMFKIKQHYPDDFRLIESWFPFVGVQVERYRMEQEEIQGRAFTFDELAAITE